MECCICKVFLAHPPLHNIYTCALQSENTEKRIIKAQISKKNFIFKSFKVATLLVHIPYVCINTHSLHPKRNLHQIYIRIELYVLRPQYSYLKFVRLFGGLFARTTNNLFFSYQNKQRESRNFTQKADKFLLFLYRTTNAMQRCIHVCIYAYGSLYSGGRKTHRRSFVKMLQPTFLRQLT